MAAGTFGHRPIVKCSAVAAGVGLPAALSLTQASNVKVAVSRTYENGAHCKEAAPAAAAEQEHDSGAQDDADDPRLNDGGDWAELESEVRRLLSVRTKSASLSAEFAAGRLGSAVARLRMRHESPHRRRRSSAEINLEIAADRRRAGHPQLEEAMLQVQQAREAVNEAEEEVERDREAHKRFLDKQARQWKETSLRSRLCHDRLQAIEHEAIQLRAVLEEKDSPHFTPPHGQESEWAWAALVRRLRLELELVHAEAAEVGAATRETRAAVSDGDVGEAVAAAAVAATNPAEVRGLTHGPLAQVSSTHPPMPLVSRVAVSEAATCASKGTGSWTPSTCSTASSSARVHSSYTPQPPQPRQPPPQQVSQEPSPRLPQWTFTTAAPTLPVPLVAVAPAPAAACEQLGFSRERTLPCPSRTQTPQRQPPPPAHVGERHLQLRRVASARASLAAPSGRPPARQQSARAASPGGSRGRGVPAPPAASLPQWRLPH